MRGPVSTTPTRHEVPQLFPPALGQRCGRFLSSPLDGLWVQPRHVRDEVASPAVAYEKGQPFVDPRRISTVFHLLAHEVGLAILLTDVIDSHDVGMGT